MRRAALVLIPFALAGCVSTSVTGQHATPSSGAGTSAPAPAAKNAAVGQALRITGDAELAASVTLVKVTTHAAGSTGSDIAEPPANGAYHVCDILITVTGGSYDYNLLYFKWQEADGTTVGPNDGHGTFSGYEPTISAGKLSAGQRIRGNVTFDAPKGHGLIQLEDPLGSVIGQWAA